MPLRAERVLTMLVMTVLIAGSGCDPLTSPETPTPASPVADPTVSATEDADALEADGVEENGSSAVTASSPVSSGSIRAFPGAQGFGAVALNECRRDRPHVFLVTNRNDSGSGSLRDAMARAESARDGDLKVIAFRVGGYIRTRSNINFSGNCLYIAGQTAPGDGVTLRGRGFEFDRDVHDVVIRHLRIRLGGDRGNGILVRKGDRYIFDHLSISWSSMTHLRFSRTPINRSGRIRDVTVQNSLMGESLSGHPTAIQIGGEPDTDYRSGQAGWRYLNRFSIHNNALVSNSHRNVNARGLNIEVINNLVHNWNLDGGQTGRAAVVDWVNNYFQKGPMSRSSYVPIGIRSVHVETTPFYQPSLYLAGNLSVGGGGPQATSPDADNWNGDSRVVDRFHNDPGTLPLTAFRRSHRIVRAPFPVSIRGAAQARDRMLGVVGASQGLSCTGSWTSRRDAVDLRYIDEIRSGSGWRRSPGPSDENAAGGYPNLDRGTACPDSNGDGIPDAWASAHGFDPADSSVAGRIGSGGYSYLEHYLNGTRP